MRSNIEFVNEHPFEDKAIVCKVCGQTFIFTAGEQLFYSDRNLDEPKRCPKCRHRRRDTLMRDESW